MQLPIKRTEQHTDECGPACLKQVLDYFDILHPLEHIEKETASKTKWRDWDYQLGIFALKNGLAVTIYTRSLDVFDMSWAPLNTSQLIQKLEQEQDWYRKNEGLPWYLPEIKNAIRFLRAGGKILFQPITPQLIEMHLAQHHPIIAAVNYPLMQGWKRSHNGEIDDIRGQSWGHLITIAGQTEKTFHIIDPSPVQQEPYETNKELLVESILRRDQNIIVFSKKTAKNNS